MAASLQGILGREYKSELDVNASQTVKYLFDRFAPDADSADILDKYGTRFIGEVPGVTFLATYNQNSAWHQPINTELSTDCINYAMQDSALPEIMNFVSPNTAFDPNVITPASLVWLANIHYFGLVTRLANHKKNDFMEQMRVICDDSLYPSIRKKLKTKYSDFVDYTSDISYKMIMTGEKENVVKTIKSSLNKAKGTQYLPPTHTAPESEHRYGVFTINDLQRTSIGPENPKDLTFEDWINMRNQVGAYVLSGALGMKCDRVADQLTEGLSFPGCNFTGISEYPLQEGVKIALRNEMQMNILTGDYGQRIIDESKVIREQMRYLLNKGTDDQGYIKARNASLKTGIQTISANLEKDIEAKRLYDGNIYDPSYSILKKAIARQNETDKKPKKSYHPPKYEVIDMSKTNFVNEFITNPKTKDAFRKMIRMN